MKKLLSFGLLLILLFALLVPASAAQATTPTGIPLLEIGDRIDELAANYLHEFTPGLAVAVVKDGEVVFLQGYGYADVEQQTPVDPAATVFTLASIGKMFVYVSVMQLVEQGLIDLDNDIHEYLPEDLAREFNFEYHFTMRDLLNHSAGFGEIAFSGFQDAEAVQTRRTLREGLLAVQPNQIFEPGTAKAYSNFGIDLAGYIVGHISGVDFADVEKASILEPLGMTNTRNQPHWFGDSAFLQNRARGHRPNGNGGFHMEPWIYMPGYPAGALLGTVEDLAQFAIALTPPQGEPGPLFGSRDTLDLMLSPSYDNPSILRGTNHGFLTFATTYPSFGHGGSLPGFITAFAIVPSHRFGVMVLQNARGGDEGILIEKIMDLLIGNSMDIPLPVTENLPDAASVAGYFHFLRRTEGNIMQAENNLARNWRIDTIDENTITLTWVVPLGLGPDIVITYQQIEPYLFRAISGTPDGRALAFSGFYELYFVMENGSPARISTSWIGDATAQTFGQSLIAFMGGFVILIISALFFLVTLIIISIGFLRKKGWKISRFTHLNNGLLVCGLLFAVNWIAFDVRLAMAAFPSLSFAAPHIWINYILLALTAVLFVASLVLFVKGQESIKGRRKVLYVLTIVFLALSLFVFWQWNYFVMM